MVDQIENREIVMVPQGAAVHVIREDQARVNVTYGGENGDLPDPVSVDATDADIRQMVTEAVRGGGVPGIAAQEPDFTDFVVDRFPPKPEEGVEHNRVFLRPKTPFGG